VSAIRQFVAIYGQEAYERLAVRAETAESLALLCRRAVEGNSKECIEMSEKKLIGVSVSVGGIANTYNCQILGEQLAKTRAAARVATAKAVGNEPSVTYHYEDGSTEAKELGFEIK
jgi:hypothetical protein